MKIVKILLLINLSILFVAGCGTQDVKMQSQRKTFSMNINPPANVSAPRNELILKINDFSIASQFDTTRMVIRDSDSRYTKDYYNGFIANPAILFAQQSQSWLSAAGICRAIVPANSVLDADYILEADIKSLYADFRELNKPQAMVEIEFFLIKPDREKYNLIFKQTYSESADMQNNTAEELVNAYEIALEKIMQRLEKDLASNLQ
jgi:ABC-type uncharacterized transport system auxiliary subunit